MINRENFFAIGRLGSAHGLKGYIDLHYTDDIFTSDSCDYLMCEIEGLLVPFFVEDWQVRSDGLAMVKFEDYDDKDSVGILQNVRVFYPKDTAAGQRTELTSWQMLTGFSVSDVHAGLLGIVEEVDDSSANVLLVVSTPKDSQILLPVHPNLVSALDINRRTITLAMPEGLIELNENV